MAKNTSRKVTEFDRVVSTTAPALIGLVLGLMLLSVGMLTGFLDPTLSTTDTIIASVMLGAGVAALVVICRSVIKTPLGR